MWASGSNHGSRTRPARSLVLNNGRPSMLLLVTVSGRLLQSFYEVERMRAEAEWLFEAVNDYQLRAVGGYSETSH